MTTVIETYLNSLPEDILTVDISCSGLTSFPDLTRFKNLQELHCYNNKLTSLPDLTRFKNLKKLHCYNNKLTSLPDLTRFKNLKKLRCSNNQLTSLPILPQNIEELICYNNKLTSLPTLPQNLKYLCCSNNQLTSLPTLPQNIEALNCDNNPISEIINRNSYMLYQKQKNIQTLNNCRHLYYCLQFKEQLRKWLWEKVREPKIQKMYNPIYLIENLGDEDDLDTVLNNWK